MTWLIMIIVPLFIFAKHWCLFVGNDSSNPGLVFSCQWLKWKQSTNSEFSPGSFGWTLDHRRFSDIGFSWIEKSDPIRSYIVIHPLYPGFSLVIPCYTHGFHPKIPRVLDGSSTPFVKSPPVVDPPGSPGLRRSRVAKTRETREFHFCRSEPIWFYNGKKYHNSFNSEYNTCRYILVGGWPTPLKNDGVKVSWDDDLPNWMEK